jgi:hypothetical protein
VEAPGPSSFVEHSPPIRGSGLRHSAPAPRAGVTSVNLRPGTMLMRSASPATTTICRAPVAAAVDGAGGVDVDRWLVAEVGPTAAAEADAVTVVGEADRDGVIVRCKVTVSRRREVEQTLPTSSVNSTVKANLLCLPAGPC